MISALRVLLLIMIAATPSVGQVGEGRHAVREDISVRAEMRDGVALVSDIYRPDTEGEFPVLLQRTPYDRKGPAAEARELASHGYIVVLQDTRGRFDSDGEFYPFLYERNDGYDTVEWAAALPASNGKVGMYGGSYVGATQMLAAISEPPHLVSIFPFVTSSEYYEGWTYQGGALMQWFAGTWSSGLARDTLRRQVVGCRGESTKLFAYIDLKNPRRLSASDTGRRSATGRSAGNALCGSV